MKTSRFLCVLRRLKPTPKPSSDGGYTQANLNMITPKRISRRQKYVQNRYSLTRYKPQIMLRTTKDYDIGGKRQMRDGMTRHSERDGTERHGTERDELEPAISFSVDAKRIIIIKRKENEKKSDAGKQFNGGTGEDERGKRERHRKKGKETRTGLWRDGTERAWRREGGRRDLACRSHVTVGSILIVFPALSCATTLAILQPSLLAALRPRRRCKYIHTNTCIHTSHATNTCMHTYGTCTHWRQFALRKSIMNNANIHR